MHIAPIAAAAASICLAGLADAGTVYFDLRGSGGLADSYTIVSTDGLHELTVTAASRDFFGNLIDARVGRWSNGMGVVHRHWDSDHRVDGSGYDDMLLFDLEMPFDIDEIWFSYVDRNDDATIVDGNGDVITSNGYELDDLRIGRDFYSSLDLRPAELETDLFGVMADGRNDEFKVTYLGVSFDDPIVPLEDMIATPTPTAAGLGLLSVVALAGRRVRRA